MTPDPDLAAARYPQVYKVKPGWLTFMIGLGSIAGISGLVGAGFFALQFATDDDASAIVFTAICLGFAALGAYMIVDALLSRVSLTADTIEYSHLWVRRRLRFEDIAGRQLTFLQYGQKLLVLVPKSDAFKRIKISNAMQSDDLLEAWLLRVPDLDVEKARIAADARSRSEAEIGQNPRFGQTPEQRMRRLAVVRKIVTTLNLAFPLAAAWCLYDPRPYAIAVASVAAVPWLAMLIVMFSRGMARIDTKRNAAHPGVAHLIIGPGIVLALRILLDVSLVTWTSVLPATVAATGVFLLMAAVADRSLRWRPKILALLAPFAFVYAGAALVLVDVLWDRVVETTFNVPVIGKHVETGKHTTWYLRLSPWGPRETPGDVSVARWLYDRSEPGDLVCVNQHPGAVGFAWFETSACGQALQPETPQQSQFAAISDKSVLRSLAETGDWVAGFHLAIALVNDKPSQEDYAEAVAWFRIGAAQANVNAEYNLGLMYREGWGIKQDYGAAAYWFRLSEYADPLSSLSLGYLFERGLGVERDLAEARRHYQRAAESGNAIAAVDLATMYTFGRGVALDHATAFRWYMLAAKQGEPRGMNGVGYSYLNGFGVGRDVAKGMAWLTAAAAAGQPNAMHTIGAEFLRGTVVPKDVESAYRWLLLAERFYPADDPLLPGLRYELGQAAFLLIPAQRTAIEEAVKYWKPAPGTPPATDDPPVAPAKP